MTKNVVKAGAQRPELEFGAEGVLEGSSLHASRQQARNTRMSAFMAAVGGGNQGVAFPDIAALIWSADNPLHEPAYAGLAARNENNPSSSASCRVDRLSPRIDRSRHKLHDRPSDALGQITRPRVTE